MIKLPIVLGISLNAHNSLLVKITMPVIHMIVLKKEMMPNRNGVNHQMTTIAKTMSIKIVLKELMKLPVKDLSHFGACVIGIKINVSQLM